MPVSPLPILIPLLLVIVLIVASMKGRKVFFRSAVVVASFIIFILSFFYIPGVLLYFRATQNDLDAQYKYARWLENNPEDINEVMFWPINPNVLEGYFWIDKAADQGHLPSLYIKGVRLKYGDHVPQPEDWDGPGGNHFPQPARGQKCIDEAIEKGFRPVKNLEEEFYYTHLYRGLYHKDPNG